MGWNGNGTDNRASRPATPQTRKPHGSIKGLLALLIVVGLSIAVNFLFIGQDKPASAPAPKPKPQIVEKSAVAASTNAVSSREDMIKARKEFLRQKAEERKAAAEKARREYVKKPGQMMLPNGKILTFPPPKEGEVRKLFAYGHMYECDHLGNFRDVTQRRLFHTAFEANFLRLAQEGKSYIPTFLTGLDEADVKKMLEKNYTPIGDETEEEWASLKAYDEMRCAALSYMEQGGKFDDFVKEYAAFDRKQREAKALGLKEVMTLYKQGRVAEAKEMATASNLMMEKNGYKPIKFPKHVQEAFDAMPDGK